jgi:hypothetical protein
LRASSDVPPEGKTTFSTYVPPTRHPVCPAVRLLTSFCAVRNGAVAVPGLESLPVVEAYLVHGGAAWAIPTAVIGTIAAAVRKETNVRRSARRKPKHVDATTWHRRRLSPDVKFENALRAATAGQPEKPTS